MNMPFKKEDLEAYNCIIIAVVLILALLIIWLRLQNQNVYFTRQAYSGLIKGDLKAAEQIDWQNFKVLGNDIGALYNRQDNELEKKDFQNAFIKSFSNGFNRSGAEFSSYARWRLEPGQPDIVAADDKAHKKTVLFFISGGAKRKLAGLAWKE